MSHASLCLLSFNRRDLLEGTIRTIHEHAGHPFELIVHDDGSKSNPDQGGAVELLEDLHEAGFISTLIINRPGHNQGQGVALNRMFRMATGDPIIKIDHDLEFVPGWLEIVQKILKSNRERSRDGRPEGSYRSTEPKLGLLGLLHYWHPPVSSATTRVPRRRDRDRYGGWDEHTHILGSAFAVTRACWRKLGPFEEHSPAFAEDWSFQNKVHRSGEFVNGLPYEDRPEGGPLDLCRNLGMGYGPSTVNVAPGEVQAIHDRPYVFGVES